MAETIKPFDVANYLRDEQDVAGFLAAVAEEGDSVAMVLALGAVARARSMAKLARDTGISREGLYKALSPGGNPSFATVQKAATALGFPLIFQIPAASKPPRGPKPLAYLRGRKHLVHVVRYEAHPTEPAGREQRVPVATAPPPPLAKAGADS